MIKKHRLLFFTAVLSISMMQAMSDEKQADKNTVQTEIPPHTAVPMYVLFSGAPDQNTTLTDLAAGMMNEAFSKEELEGLQTQFNIVMQMLNKEQKEALEELGKMRVQQLMHSSHTEEKPQKREVFYSETENYRCINIAQALNNEKLPPEERIIKSHFYHLLKNPTKQCVPWDTTLTMEEQVKQFDPIFENPKLIYTRLSKGEQQAILTQKDRENIDAIAQIENPEERRQQSINFFLQNYKFSKILSHIWFSYSSEVN